MAGPPSGRSHQEPTRVWLGRECFVVAAERLPPGEQQRPGVTVLLGRRGPLTVELPERGVCTGWAFLLVPEQRRRFVGAQPHYSVTIEPGHGLYTGYLSWARDAASGKAAWTQIVAAPARVDPFELESLATTAAFDAWLRSFMVAYGVEPRAAEPLLLDLFMKLAELEAAHTDATAEDLWRTFRAKRPGDQAYWSRWLHGQIGISLRKLMLWRKMRRAIEAAVDTRNATAVAHAAGFADSAHMSRVCLRTLGVRPSDVQNDKTVQVLLLAPG
jgi:hypothetical protein